MQTLTSNLAVLCLGLVVAGCGGGRDHDPLPDGSPPGQDAASQDAASQDAASQDAPSHTGEACTLLAGVPSSDPGTVTCGRPATVCSVTGGHICCTQQGVSAGTVPGSGSCVAPTSCDSVAKKACDEAADCPPGNSCCFNYGGGGGDHRDIISSCMSVCPFGRSNQACKTDAECGAGRCASYAVNGYVVSTCAAPSPSCR